MSATDWRLDPDEHPSDLEARAEAAQADHEQQAVHDPILRREPTAHHGVRWRLSCICGNVPAGAMTRDEVNDEMRKHPVVP